MNVLVWAGWYPKDENSYGAIFVKKHLQIIGKKYHLRIFHITNHSSFSFNVKQNNTAYGIERIYFIPDLKLITLLAFLFVPMYEYLSTKTKVDILHIHCSYPIILFAFTLKLFGLKKIVLTEHWSGYTSNNGKFDKMPFLLKGLLRKALSSVNAISVVSKVLLTEMEHRKLIPIHNLIIPNVVKFPENLIDNKPSDYISFFTICRLEDKSKNISGMIKAFNKALQINSNLKFTIYGDGVDEKKLKLLASDLNLLDSKVFFKGYIPNHTISDVYLSHHVFISFSNYETFSIVTAEALTHGVPVIASKSGGPEYYVNKNNGLLVNCKNENELADAILYLAKNIESYNSSEISKSMKKLFSDEEILKGFDKLYNI